METMKAILEFNLPDDRADHLIALHGIDMFCFLVGLRDDIRQHIKHGTDLPKLETLYTEVNQLIDQASPE